MTSLYKKIRLSTAFFLLLATGLHAQSGYQKDYKFLLSTNLTADKNFYWLTVIDQTPAVKNVLATDVTLKSINANRLDLLRSHVADTCSWAVTLVVDFRFTTADSTDIAAALHNCYQNNKAAFDAMIDHHLRPSGYYQRFVTTSNEDLLLHAWGQTVVGINYIIDQFGLGKKLRYPGIDSASYDVNSRYYRTALKDMFAFLSEQTGDMTVFYHPSLAIAIVDR